MSLEPGSKLRLFALTLVTIAGFGGVFLLGVKLWTRFEPETQADRLPRTVAIRSDLDTTIRAGGQIESVEKTLIECELESVSLYSGSGVMTARNASTIIELIPEGSQVVKGDILCRLDSSDYEELVRQQEIKLQESLAEQQKAIYDLKAAQVALLEYREGTLTQRRQDIESRLTLAMANIQRQQDRVNWAEKMVNNKYMAEGQLIAEREFLLRNEIQLRRVQGEKRQLEGYVSIATIARMEYTVDRLATELEFQKLRHKRREDQMSKFKQQIDRCTIRAPHDGIVIYATTPDSKVRIEEGTEVHQKMDLFYLPNFKAMEVLTVVNESFLGKIATGMTSKVRIEALHNQEFSGEVVAISTLPLPPAGPRAGNDIQNFLATIKLLDAPEGIMPGMTAEVEIETGHHEDALVIPTTAVKVEDGNEICYVSTPDHTIERRKVDVEPATQDLLEVTAGLQEGEVVISEPYLIDESMSVVDRVPPPSADQPTHTWNSQPLAWGMMQGH